jgi:hypothetical protein
VVVIVGVMAALALTLGQAVYSGPPTYPDPLTTRAGYTIAAGNFAYLHGKITGEDYIVGNYTVVTPPGTQVVFQVFNASEFAKFVAGHPATPVAAAGEETAGRIVFAAPYTDMFYLVFENPYPATSQIAIQVFAVTNYESNVVLG